MADGLFLNVVIASYTAPSACDCVSLSMDLLNNSIPLACMSATVPTIVSLALPPRPCAPSSSLSPACVKYSSTSFLRSSIEPPDLAMALISFIAESCATIIFLAAVACIAACALFWTCICIGSTVFIYVAL